MSSVATAPPSGSGRRSSPTSWRLGDRLVLLAAWLVGFALCAIAGAIVLYLGVEGISYLRPSLIFDSPQASTNQAGSGGFLDPLLGTLILTVIAVAFALPLAVASATWVVEYGQGGRARRYLSRVVESSIEIVAGTPDIVIALFGLAVFQTSVLAPFSFRAEGGGVYGRSFLACGIMLSLLALPPLYTATRDGLQAVPMQMREAAFALGKTRITTIRRVLLGSVRTNIATGAALGISRVVGSTAMVLFLAQATLRIETQGSFPLVNLLRGTGPSLTSYVYENSPAGEGAAPQKAYAAAFVLLVLVLALNIVIERIGRRNADGSDLAAVTGVV